MSDKAKALAKLGLKSLDFGSKAYDLRWKIGAVVLALFLARMWVAADRAHHKELGRQECVELQRNVDTGVAGAVEEGKEKAREIDDDFDERNDQIDQERAETLDAEKIADREREAYRQGRRDARREQSQRDPIPECLTDPANMPSGLYDSGRSLQRDIFERTP